MHSLQAACFIHPISETVWSCKCRKVTCELLKVKADSRRVFILDVFYSLFVTIHQGALPNAVRTKELRAKMSPKWNRIFRCCLVVKIPEIYMILSLHFLKVFCGATGTPCFGTSYSHRFHYFIIGYSRDTFVMMQLNLSK